MASLVLGVVGAGIGAIFGGPGGAALGWSAAMTLAGIVFPPQLESQERGKIDDLRVSGSGYGAVIPQVWGKSRLGGNIIWAEKLKERKREEDVGGKGGPTQEVTTFSYFGRFAMAVCKGPIVGIKRIWAEDIKIYDDSNSPNTKYDMTIYLGDETQTADPYMESFEGAGNVPAYRGLAYVVFEDLPLKKWGNRIPAMTFEVNTGAETVSTIIADIIEQVGITSAEYDLSASSAKTVKGFLVASRQEASALIEPLLRCFFTDLIEADGKVKSVARATGTEMTLLAEDVGTHFFEEAEPKAPMEIRRIQEFELPVSVEVTYFSDTKRYQTGSQIAVRYTKGHLDEKLTVNTPIVMSNDEARQIAETILYDQWLMRESVRVTIPPKYLRVLPGTTFNLAISGVNSRFRTVSVDTALWGPIEISAVRDETLVISQTIGGGGLGIDDGDDLDNPDTIAIIAFSSNAIRDIDANTVGFYVAAVGQEGWEGVTLYRKRSGNAFRSIGTLTSSATYGMALNALATPLVLSTGVIQASSQYLDVNMVSGIPETTSVDDLLAGANAALIGNEVIQFQTVTALGGTQYRLSGLLRGQRGTDTVWKTADHAIGDRFLLITEGTVERFEVPRDLIGKAISLKAITDYEELADVSPIALTITGNEFKPYSPVQIKGSRDGSSNLTITWVRRARKNGEMQSYSDVELDELAERYKVEIWNSTYTILKRTITGITSPTTYYSAADQITDFGSPQASVYVKVFQLGDFKAGTTTSRMDGYPGTATV